MRAQNKHNKTVRADKKPLAFVVLCRARTFAARANKNNLVVRAPMCLRARLKQLVVVRVKDTGVGLDPEILPRLFYKFATKSHHSHTGVGVGLGLFICKNIVEAHGGKIWAKNNFGEKGATFHVVIPA